MSIDDERLEELTKKLIREQGERLAREAQLQALVQAAHDAIVTVDSSGRIIEWNPAATRIFGFTKNEVIGRDATIIMPEEQRPRHKSALARVMKTGYSRVAEKGTVTRTGIDKDGNPVNVELTLALYEAHGQRFMTAIMREKSD